MLQLTKTDETYVYTDEADILNKIMFGQTASVWKTENKDLAKSGRNQRDYATTQQLVILANLETLNAHFISEGKTKRERVNLLIESAERQYRSFILQEEEQSKSLKK